MGLDAMSTTANRFDVIVIGGGHNGLVTAGLLAKRGRRVVLLERRDQVGGAAITEQPWGPSFKMTSLSYVVSLMPPTVLRELELEKHGYKVYPQYGYFVPYEDGRHLQMHADAERRHAQIAKFSRKDADAMVSWDAWLGGLGAVLGPILGMVPPKIGSKQLGDLLDQLGLGWKLRDLSPTQIADITRLMTMSVADILEEQFESRQVLGALAVSGIIGTWAGPRSPGTAYVMAHHKIGNVGEGEMGSWGFPEGGMGGVTQAMRKAAEAFGATIRTRATVERILRALGLESRGASETSVTFRPPSWRSDLEREIDLIEEVARVHGYEHIPEDRAVPLVRAPRGARERVESLVREAMTGCGENPCVWPGASANFANTLWVGSAICGLTSTA